MHFFFAANNPPPSDSLEHVQDDHVTLRVCLDDAQTHSGDVLRASFELVGPKKYAGNVKLDYVVLYLYGVYILNQEVLTACTNGPLVQKQENLNLPFYRVNEEKAEQKFLLFYSNPIVLCTDVNFGSPSETTHYQLSCILPPFLPPTYNGKLIRFKYCMYVQAVKRLYRNRTQFITKRYEQHIPLRVLCGRCIRSPVLDLVLLPIKPSSSQGEGATTGHNGGDPPECLYHDFRHLYNRIGKTPLDRLLCIYLISSQRKEDSSLFLLNHVLPNYNYFYYMHIFLYVAHHWDHYTGELSRREASSHEGESHNAALPKNRKGLLMDKTYTIVDTIVKCMQEGDMYRRINTRMIKSQSLSPLHLASDSATRDDGVVIPSVKDDPNELPNKNALQNIYRINSDGKNICHVTLLDGMDNQVTDSFPCGGIINVRLYFGDASICTVHVDIRLKRVERIKINSRFLTVQRNKLHDENELASLAW
ncbi:hypothetical protein PCYB_032520, partial [Plasmodium cynomolgi strain B]